MSAPELDTEMVDSFKDLVNDLLGMFGTILLNLFNMVWDDPYTWGSLIMLLGIATTIQWWLSHRG